MLRARLLRILNPLMGLLLLNQAVTGFAGDRLTPRAFEVLHEGGAILLLIAAAAHVILNWSWIRSSYFAGRRKKAAEAAAESATTK